MAGFRFHIPDPGFIQTIQAELATRFDGLRPAAGEERFAVMDSFDGRFHGRGLLVLEAEGRFWLEDQASGRTLASCPTKPKHPPRAARDFPASAFATRIAAILEMRVLLPLGTVTRRWASCDLLNRDQKTVARLILETYALAGEPETVSRCRIEPVRGYPKALQRVEACLTGLGLRPAAGHPVVDLLEVAGRSPGGYCARATVDLRPDTPAAQAARAILAHLVGVMHRNLPGLREDLDTEFLHDFRVSVRRSRSLLAQLKDVFDRDTTVLLKEQLKTIGAVTAEVRDLDVYLLREPAYTALVPPFLEPGIVQLFRNLKRKRRLAFGRLVKALEGEAFRSALAGLDGFSEGGSGDVAAGGAGGMPIIALAKTAISRRYDQIVKHGRRIGADSPDERFHELRLECKKLRYLLEFFAALFPPKTMAALIRQLKQLQDNLGELNDLKVQQEFLLDQLRKTGVAQDQDPLVSGATGGLITQLAANHQAIRDRFFGVFEAFQSPGNRKRFKKLFT